MNPSNRPDPWGQVTQTDIDLFTDTAPLVLANALAERTGWPAVIAPGPNPDADQLRWPAGVQAPDGNVVDVAGVWSEADWLRHRAGYDDRSAGITPELYDPAAVGIDLDQATWSGPASVRAAATRVAAAVTSDPQFMAAYGAHWGSTARQETMGNVVDRLADRFPDPDGQVLRQVGLMAASQVLEGTDTLAEAGQGYRAARDEAQVFTARLTGALMATDRPVEDAAAEAGIDVGDAKRLLGVDVPTIYGKKNCPACALTERALRSYGIEPRKVDLGDLAPDEFARVTEGFQQAPVVHLPGVEPFSGFRPDALKDWAQGQQQPGPASDGPGL